MGTFIIRPTHLVSGGVPLTDGNSPDTGWNIDSLPSTVLDTMLLTGDPPPFLQINSFAAPSFVNTARFDFVGNSFYLDGSGSPIAFSGLPAGFNPDSASVKIDWYDIGIDGNAQFFLQQASGINGVSNTASFDYITVPSIFNLWDNGCGLKISLNADSSGIRYFKNLRVEGTYSIVSASWYVDPTNTKKYKYGPNPGSPYIPTTTPIYNNPVIGDYITPPIGIVPPSPWIPWVPTSPITLTLPIIITPDKIPFIPVPFTPISFDPLAPPPDIPPLAPFIPISFDPIIFKPIPLDIPDDYPPSDFPIIFTQGPPTDNGYTVNIGGAATIQFIGSPSGIYTLIKDKTSDTLYDRTGAVSIDVAIPNPFIVTGFLPD